MLRSDSRRDTDAASNFDNSSRRSMIDTFLLEENWDTAAAYSGQGSKQQDTVGLQQVPWKHTCPTEHAWKQPPQCCALLDVSTHIPPQSVSEHGDSTQEPFRQTVPAAHTYPQAPQLYGSEFRSVHVPLQQVAHAGQQA